MAVSLAAGAERRMYGPRSCRSRAAASALAPAPLSRRPLMHRRGYGAVREPRKASIIRFETLISVSEKKW